MMQGTATDKRGATKQGGRRKPSLTVRVLIAILIVIAVGAISFGIGYVIGLQLGVAVPLLALL